MFWEAIVVFLRSPIGIIIIIIIIMLDGDFLQTQNGFGGQNKIETVNDFVVASRRIKDTDSQPKLLLSMVVVAGGRLADQCHQSRYLTFGPAWSVIK